MTHQANVSVNVSIDMVTLCLHSMHNIFQPQTKTLVVSRTMVKIQSKHKFVQKVYFTVVPPSGLADVVPLPYKLRNFQQYLKNLATYPQLLRLIRPKSICEHHKPYMLSLTNLKNVIGSLRSFRHSQKEGTRETIKVQMVPYVSSFYNLSDE